uniref:Uncharacterized protein n=1 Tax=Arundo donax TaxID=35708 RepID=A0A0A9BYR7_ARUDO
MYQILVQLFVASMTGCTLSTGLPATSTE